MRLTECAWLSLVLGCATMPREPYVWRDDVPLVGVHRADVARAEGKVIEHLLARGTLMPEEASCRSSARAYQVTTAETEAAYQVGLIARPGLCEQAPENTTLPPIPPTVEGPMMFAVSKKDFHLIRARLAGDPAVPKDFGPPESMPPRSNADAGMTAQPAPSALVFTTPSLSASAGACAGPIGVETRGASRASQAVAAPVTVNLAVVPPSGVFFSDAKCTAALTSASVGAGTSRVEFYFRAMQVGPLRISASAAGLSGDSQAHTVEPGRAVMLTFTTPPQTVAQGTCSGAVTVQARDAFDNLASVAAKTPVQLLATPAGGVTFYVRPDCTGATITRTSIPAGGNSASVYFKSRLPRTVAIAAALGTGSATQDAVITSARPSPSRSPRQPGR